MLGSRSDYQLGRTKVFLKDAQDLFLEQERDRVLTKKIQVLQRCIRGWYHRRRFLKMRAAAVVIQKNFRWGAKLDCISFVFVYVVHSYLVILTFSKSCFQNLNGCHLHGAPLYYA